MLLKASAVNDLITYLLKTPENIWFPSVLREYKIGILDRNGLMLIVILREKCLYSELLCTVFSRIWTEYGEILRISTYAVQMRENTDQNNSEYGHFLRSVIYEINTPLFNESLPNE